MGASHKKVRVQKGVTALGGPCLTRVRMRKSIQALDAVAAGSSPGEQDRETASVPKRL